MSVRHLTLPLIRDHRGAPMADVCAEGTAGGMQGHPQLDCGPLFAGLSYPTVRMPEQKAWTAACEPQRAQVHSAFHC